MKIARKMVCVVKKMCAWLRLSEIARLRIVYVDCVYQFNVWRWQRIIKYSAEWQRHLQNTTYSMYIYTMERKCVEKMKYAPFESMWHKIIRVFCEPFWLVRCLSKWMKNSWAIKDFIGIKRRMQVPAKQQKKGK